MKKAIAMAWADELDSGKYKQGRGQLRNEQNKFCCLGVLCNMHAEAKPKFAAKQTLATFYGDWQDIPPPNVINWAGLKYRDGSVAINGVSESLAELNDDGATFKTIAEIIRKHWRQL